MKITVLRSATLTYIGALSLIACLSIGTHLLIESVVVEQGTAARVINLAGRQRMLSQRIAQEALELHYAAGSNREAVLARLRFDIDRMETSNAALAHGSATLGIPPPATVALRSIFERAPYDVDRRVQRFVEIARAYALESNTAASDAELREIITSARDVLLNALDTAVTQYQADSDAIIRRLHTLLQGVLVMMLCTLFAEALFIFRPMFRQLKATQMALLEAARTDPLTGSMNRRYLLEQGENEISRCIQNNSVLSVLVLDIDDFKSVNDRFGHPIGDHAIQTVVRCVSSMIRESDHFGRVGGEEFMIIFPDTPQEDAVLMGERIREHIASTVVHSSAGDFTLTASIGVAQWYADEAGLMPTIDRADKALYLAKRNGRNRVEQNQVASVTSVTSVASVESSSDPAPDDAAPVRLDEVPRLLAS